MSKKYISWRRVSTFKQNRSGLGLEAQKEIIRYFVERDGGELIADYAECYTGKELSGCKELRKAMMQAKKTGAILVIAKSDRFRNCQEALGILTEMGEGNIEFCDLPHSDRFTLTLFWALAEREALITSIRTKQALAALKARGDVKLGAANEKYQANRAKKSKEQLREIEMKKGQLKNKRCLESRDSVAFLKAIHRVFPDHTTDEDYRNWEWGGIRLRCGYLEKMIDIMKDFRDMDSEGKVFQRWDFESPLLPKRLRAYLCSFKKSVMYSTNNN